ncbi:MAG: metallophosphoesterase [Flavisolibacter sp.]|nr:metallophosphoesterase [Flavisolibacter sp.]
MMEMVENKILAFASDTQAPMLVETLWLRSFNNREATKLLFKDVQKRNPKQFFLLGDVVNLGYSQKQWKPVDVYLNDLRKNDIPVYAILGNHEVMGQPKKGTMEFQKRFPDHERTGYSVKCDDVAVVLLNSNFGQMTPDERKHQEAWLRQTLDELDADANVQFVITCCHHSPYTNSRIVKPSLAVQHDFVPAFLSSKKSQLFLSGHAHAFEHFIVGSKDFLVIGGGGGLKQPLRKGLGSLADLSEDYKPMFHYLTLYIAGDHLKITSWHLKKDFSGFEEGLELQIKKQPALISSVITVKE